MRSRVALVYAGPALDGEDPELGFWCVIVSDTFACNVILAPLSLKCLVGVSIGGGCAQNVAVIKRNLTESI